MEIRVLEYFLAVAQEESILGAANFLHLTQPTLSRQMKELEEEIGKPLFIRGQRRITLTEEGILLRKRAGEILALVRKTENELTSLEDTISGDIYLSASEMDAFRFFAIAAERLRKKHPGIHFHFYTGNGHAATEQLDNGLVDFSILIEPANVSRYNYLFQPAAEVCGIMLRTDSPLAQKAALTPDDLRDVPLIVPELFMEQDFFAKWMGVMPEQLNIVATGDSPYNAAWLAAEGIGNVVCLNFELLVGDAGSRLCFRPLDPPLTSGVYLVWKKYQVFSRAAELFLKELRGALAQPEN